jgi:hypothetical protein
MENPNIRDLFPDLTEEDLEVNKETLDRYLDLIYRIRDRWITEGEAVFNSSPPDQ